MWNIRPIHLMRVQEATRRDVPAKLFYLATFIDVYDIINSAFCLSVILNRHMSLSFSSSREHNRRIP